MARRMPTPLSSRTEPAVLPSIPPSPSLLEEVFGQPRPWSVRLEESDLQGSRRSSSGSGGGLSKGKAKGTSDDEDQGDQRGVGSQEAYPPMTDEAAETRRVEETLKRWELAERQRRKSARESVQQTSGPSLLASVTRTASLVLSRRSRAGSIGVPVGPNGTRAFKSQEAVDITREGYAVPLDDIDHSAHASSGQDVAVHSPAASPSQFNHSTTASTDAGTRSNRTSENPFVHPSERGPASPPLLVSVTPTRPLRPSTPPSPTPFAGARARQAGQVDLTTRTTERKLHTRSLSSGGITFVDPRLPPRPLGLPFSPESTPRAVPLQPTPQPALRSPRHETPEEPREEVRWWHDWLCGCGEGPDRGGDFQAGRTNPFE